MTALLSCENVVFRHGARVVLNDVSLAFRRGEAVGLLGVNGAGKSTLLKILLGLWVPTSGRVLLEGRPLRSVRRREVARHLAYVPQAAGMYFPFTVEEIVSLGRVPQAGLGRRMGARDREAVEAAMERLDLTRLRHRDGNTLSGGERQRVLLARALAQGAEALILDEPLTGLDFGHQHRMLALLRTLAAEGRLVVLTSHRPDELFGCSGRVLLLRDGVVTADGAPEDVLTGPALSALYETTLRQIDHGARRFFLHDDEAER